MKELENFWEILGKENPELRNKVELNITKRAEPRYFVSERKFVQESRSYQFSMEFPSRFRDEIYSLSKFCGLELHHEYTTYEEERTIFSSPEIFY